MESKDNKKLVDSQAEEVDTSAGTAADVDEVMKKYDRESNTRIWEGTPKMIVKAIMVLFSVYCIYVTLFVGGLLEIRLTRFLAFILVIGYLNFPIKKGITKVNYLPWYDWIIMILGAGSFLYFSFRAREILMLATKVSKDPLLVAIAIIGTLALVELCRRCVGLPILCVAGALLIYTFATVRFGKVVYDLFFTTNGIMGTPVQVCSK